MLSDLLKLILSVTEKASAAFDPIATDRNNPQRVILARDGYKLIELPRGKGASPAEMHSFDDVPSLVAWLKRRADATTAQIYADAGDGRITALTSARWDRSAVTCDIAEDPGFRALGAALGKALTQESLRALMHRLRDSLANSTDAITAISTFDATISGTITQHIDPKTGAKKLRAVSAGTEYPINLPAELVFTLPIYVSGAPTRITISLCPDVVAGRPVTFALTWPEREAVMDAAFRAQVAALRLALGDGWLVMLGKPSIET